MGIRTQRVTMVAATATGLVNLGVANGNDGTFANVGGANGDELPVTIMNIDATNTINIGGPEVSASQGLPLAPGFSMTFKLMGTDAQSLKGFPVAGTPIAVVMVGRQ